MSGAVTVPVTINQVAQALQGAMNGQVPGQAPPKPKVSRVVCQSWTFNTVNQSAQIVSGPMPNLRRLTIWCPLTGGHVLGVVLCSSLAQLGDVTNSYGPGSLYNNPGANPSGVVVLTMGTRFTPPIVIENPQSSLWVAGGAFLSGTSDNIVTCVMYEYDG